MPRKKTEPAIPTVASEPGHGVYSGLLAQRGLLTTPTPSLFSSESFLLYAECRLALYRHYGIDHSDENADRDLITALAAAHVPAFQPPLESVTKVAKTGRPPKISTPADVVCFLVELNLAWTKAQREYGRKVSDRKIIDVLMKSRFIKARQIKRPTVKRFIEQFKCRVRFEPVQDTPFMRAFDDLLRSGFLDKNRDIFSL